MYVGEVEVTRPHLYLSALMSSLSSSRVLGLS